MEMHMDSHFIIHQVDPQVRRAAVAQRREEEILSALERQFEVNQERVLTDQIATYWFPFDS